MRVLSALTAAHPGLYSAGCTGGMGGGSKSTSAKRIQKELAELSLDPPANCSAGPKGDNIYEWVTATLTEPRGWSCCERISVAVSLLDVHVAKQHPACSWIARRPDESARCRCPPSWAHLVSQLPAVLSPVHCNHAGAGQ